MSGFSYFRFTAVAAVLAMTLIPCLRTSTATSRLSPIGIPGADLRNEERVLAKYFDDLVSYEKECAQVEKRARLVSADLDAVQRKSEDLKGRLSEVQNAIREIVRKLKAANEWDTLDKDLVSRITDVRDKSFFQQNSLKKLLEDSSNNFTSHGSEITTPLDNLRKKVAGGTSSPIGEVQFVRARYHAPAPFFAAGLKCLTANIRLGLLWRLDARESKATQNERICACSGGATCTNTTT